jgi:hypothetical protein
VDPLHRRGLINGALAFAATFVVGAGVVAGMTSEGLEIPRAMPSEPPSATPPPPGCRPSWEVVQSADPGDAPTMLLGVAAVAAGEAWAVGASGDPEEPAAALVELWDGRAWTAEKVPNPGSVNELRAVDAAGPNDVWAVGRTVTAFGGDRPFALHYDGARWLEVALPEEIDGVLNGVAAIAADDVWVVGFTGEPAASLERALIMHWDGQLWAVVDGGRAIGSGKSALRDLEAVAPNDLWAVGYLHNRPLIIHFDGERWERSDTDAEGETIGIEPATPSEVWAVGTPIRRFDGEAWAPTTNVREEAELRSVAAVGPNDVWAVGHRPTADATTRSLVVRYDGSGWRPVRGAGVSGSDTLTAVDALADGTVLGVGFRDIEAGRRTLAIRGTTCLPPQG